MPAFVAVYTFLFKVLETDKATCFGWGTLADTDGDCLDATAALSEAGRCLVVNSSTQALPQDEVPCKGMQSAPECQTAWLLGQAALKVLPLRTRPARWCI